MRKFEISPALTIGSRLAARLRQQQPAPPTEPETRPAPPPPEPDDFEARMHRAFPPHLRGSISGCCDSMADGHGTE